MIGYLRHIILLVVLSVCFTSLTGQTNSEIAAEIEKLSLLEPSQEKIDAIDLFIDSTNIKQSKNNYYNILTVKALTYENLGQPTESLKSFLQAKQLIEKDEKDETYSDLLFKIGDLYSIEGLHSESTKYFEEALEIMMLKYPDHPLTIDLMEANGDAYAAMLVEEKAMFFYQEILFFFEANNNLQKQIQTLQRIVKLFYGLNKYDEALLQNEKLRALIEKSETNNELYLILNNLGFNYLNLSDFSNAIKYFNQSIDALKLHKYNKLDHFKILNNIAIAYSNKGEYNKSIDAYFASEKLLDGNDWKSRGNLDLLMAKTFLKNQDYQTAMKKANDAIEKGRDHNQSDLLAEAFFTVAQIYSEQNLYSEAIKFFEDYFELRDSINYSEKIKADNLLNTQRDLERTEEQMKILTTELELEKSEKGKLVAEAEKRKLDIERQAQELKLQQESLKIEALQRQEERQRRALAEQQIANLELESKREEQDRKFETQKNELEKVEQARKLEQSKTEAAELNLLIAEGKRKNANRFLILGLIISLLMLAGIINMFWTNKKLNSKNKEIEAQKQQISNERAKSDLLLNNILPVQTAKELKETGFSYPRLYKYSSVLFTDFSGFSRVVRHMDPQQIVKELDECFLAFDEIIEKHDLEKIKTIGDAYMCAGGLPMENESNPYDCVLAAIEMQEYMEALYKEKTKNGNEYWRMRIGIHTGPVVAGVVGRKKFSYDIWGDTVNIASRMESHGQVGKVNISPHTYSVIKDRFNCVYRGKFAVKNVGEMSMYFVEGEV